MLNQIVPWYGGKAALARLIVHEFGPHRAYFEPFAGGFGIIFRKPVTPHETLNDLHEDVTNLARVVADSIDSAALVRRLGRRLNCEALHNEARARLREPFAPGPERAADFFFVSWLAMNGFTGSTSTQTYTAKYQQVNSSKCQKLRSAIDSIRHWHERLRSVAILNRDGFELLARLPDEHGAVIYCDPPYVKKGGTYRFDFAAGDHDRLAKALGRFRKSRVIVSYYDDPLLDRLYAGWHKRIMVEWKHRPQNGVSKPKPPEILLMNGPSLVTPKATRIRGRVDQVLAV
ncbi:MAG: DNA adenine methylase [Planctomycetaceae bacterium]|nr:DNA adenine methylase [Planctomycetaceae bacterium]